VTFPHVRVSGGARERGRQYGEQAASRVRRSVDAYAVIFEHYAGWDWDRVRAEADRYTEPITTFGAAYADEIRGVAEGAELAYEDVLAINVRTEVMYAAKARNAAMTLPRTLECTAFAAVPHTDSSPVLIGQNWDWKTHASGTTVVLEVDPDDGPRFVTVVEAGLLAKTGFNAAGVGVATNALVTDQDLGVPGVPYHVLLRALLDARTPAEALATLQRSPRSSSAHYLVAHRDHLALGVEAAPGGFADLHLTQPDRRGVVLHTNHLTHPGIRHVDVGVWLMPDSVFRLQRADRWLDQHDPFDPATYESLLSDHAGHPTGVCCHPDPTAIAPEQDSTVFSLVMDLGAMTMRLADGRPCETDYRTLDYSGFLGGFRA
jgi:isopenicillin-N N-acyltransferase-like protein